jgi:hypothetical protein
MNTTLPVKPVRNVPVLSPEDLIVEAARLRDHVEDASVDRMQRDLD